MRVVAVEGEHAVVAAEQDHLVAIRTLEGGLAVHAGAFVGCDDLLAVGIEDHGAGARLLVAAGDE